MMTQDEQRIALAEWMGEFKDSHLAKWKRLEGGWRACEVCGRVQGTLRAWPICGYPNLKLPDYPNDLNAMHGVEKKIVKEQKGFRYSHNLYNVVVPLGGQPYMASASQRSESACRTLWPERWI